MAAELVKPASPRLCNVAALDTHSGPPLHPKSIPDLHRALDIASNMPESVVMESLSLSDGQPYHRRSEQFYPSKDRRHRSPRLPTPENSRSSKETFESTSPYESGPAVRDLLQRHGPERNMSLGLPHGPTHFRRDSRNTGAPHSPPYGSGDLQQKVSLPPLKTVSG